MAALVTPIVTFASGLIDRFIPDKEKAAEAKAALLSQEVQGDVSALIAQLDVNRAEASNSSRFVAGWRPGVGWICGAAMAYGFIVQPFLVTILQVIQCVHAHRAFTKDMLPIVDMSQMWPVLLGLLGLGGLHTFENVQNGKSQAS